MSGRELPWILALVGALAVGSSCDAPPESTPRSRRDGEDAVVDVPVVTTTDGSDPLSPQVPSAHLALVVPRFTIELGSPDAAVLAAVARLGERVDARAVVATLSNVDLQHALEVAEASAASTASRVTATQQKARLARAESEETAKIEDYVSKVERRRLEHETLQAQASNKAARSELVAEKIQIQRLRDRVAALTLRAPFAAHVAGVHRDPGALLAAGEPIVRLASVELVIRFAVDANEVHEFPIGQRVEFVDASGRIGSDAEVSAISPTTDAAGMVLLEAVLLPTSDGPVIRAGSQGHVHRRP